jgi:WD40 repeat protein
VHFDGTTYLSGMAMAGRDGVERFSLLLLEEGEVLLDDIGADYEFVIEEKSAEGEHMSTETTLVERFLSRSTGSRTRGRAKFGSRNIFFDADDWRIPVLRLPISSISSVIALSGDGAVFDAATSPAQEFAATSAEHYKRIGDSVPYSSQSTIFRQIVDGSHGTVNRRPDSLEISALETAGSNCCLHSDVTRGYFLEISSAQLTFQRENGADHPYVHSSVKGKHVLYPLYSDTGRVVKLVQWLRTVSSNPSSRERENEVRKAIDILKRAPFDIAALAHGPEENILFDEPCTAIYALAKAPGRLCISGEALYFVPIHGMSGGSATCVLISAVKSVRHLQHGIRDAAFEIGYEGSNVIEWTGEDLRQQTLMIALESTHARDRAVRNIHQLAAPRKLVTFHRVELENAVNSWRAGDTSNFDYLMYLNFAAGRSFNDLSQYPVFPWVISDYSSERLDLGDPDSFRELSLPIGALNQSRLEILKDRFHEMPSPRFFYGTHYSTPAYIINYLVRTAPAAMLRLQNGNFDSADRIFSSISETWRGVNSNTTDVKELIPEFFAISASETPSGLVPSGAAAGEFLDNVLGLDLGTRQDGKRVSDVELPPWAQGSSDVFVRKNRDALESEHVSRHIHDWIDLIFGVKARSADACNVFYTDVAGRMVKDPSTNVEDLDDNTLAQLDTVFLEFGRTPEQLFKHPHPQRFGTLKADFMHSLCDKKSEGYPDAPKYLASCISDDETCSRECTERIGAVEEQSDVFWTVKSRSPFDRRRSLSLRSPSSSFMERLAKDARGLPEVFYMNSAESDGALGTLLDVSMTVVSSEQLALSTNALTPIIVTAWSDGYLRVYADLELRRSRHVEDLTAVACASSGNVFAGTNAGNIFAYNVGTGRSYETCCAAHDTAITSLSFCPEKNILVSSSLDASVKVWRAECPEGQLFPSLRRVQDLDAEDAVVELCVDHEGQTLYIAVLTSKDKVTAWAINIGEEYHQHSRIEHPTPIFEIYLDIGKHKTDEKTAPNQFNLHSQRICWVDSAPRRRMLATLIKSDHNADTVRLWYLDTPNMPAAEIALPAGRILCVARGGSQGTLFVAGMKGFVAEYDRTGFALCRATLMRKGMHPEQAVTSIVVFPAWSTVIAVIKSSQVLVWRGQAKRKVRAVLFE